VSNTKVSS